MIVSYLSITLKIDIPITEGSRSTKLQSWLDTYASTVLTEEAS